MTCPISKQIAEHVNDEEATTCLLEHCNGNLIFEAQKPLYSILYCEECKTPHYIDCEGLTHG